MGKNKIKPEPVAKDPMPEPELASEFEGNALEGPEAGNTLEPEDSVGKKRQQVRQAKIRSAMDGTFVLDKGRNHWSLILYVFILALIVITNNYLSEKVLRESAAIKAELKDLQYRQISAKAEWMRLSRQSSVAKMLDSAGVKESVIPPFKIKSSEPEGHRWWKKK